MLVRFASKNDGNGAKEQGTHVKPMFFVINRLLHNVEGKIIHQTNTGAGKSCSAEVGNFTEGGLITTSSCPFKRNEHSQPRPLAPPKSPRGACPKGCGATCVALQGARNGARNGARKLPGLCPKLARRVPEVGPKLAQSGPKVGPKLAQSLPNVGPKLAQSWRKVGPKLARSWPKVGPKLTQSWPEVGPKFVPRAQKVPA